VQQPIEIVNQFLDLTSPKGRDVNVLLPQISEMLAEDFVFSGPLLRVEGRENYIAMLGQFLAAHVDFKVKRQFADGDDVCSIDELTVRSPSGALVRMPMAEWFKLRNRTIISHEIYYDPREFAEAFGM
jgi:limonene-1,2-epoxide hydrolase